MREKRVGVVAAGCETLLFSPPLHSTLPFSIFKSHPFPFSEVSVGALFMTVVVHVSGQRVCAPALA